jgi:hydrogenase-4 membrane subunit HyfE
VSGAVTWVLVALGLAVVVVRRRSFAVAFVTIQALVLAAAGAADASTAGEGAAAAVLALRAICLAAVLLLVLSRTREPRPVPSHTPPLARGALAVCLALTLAWLVPPFGFASPATQRATLALIAFGLVTVATRRATLLQVVGIVVVENGVALAALDLPGAASFLTELGVAFDLTLVAFVAAVFHERIFALFGAGDSAALGALRD